MCNSSTLATSSFKEVLQLMYGYAATVSATSMSGVKRGTDVWSEPAGAGLGLGALSTSYPTLQERVNALQSQSVRLEKELQEARSERNWLRGLLQDCNESKSAIELRFAHSQHFIAQLQHAMAHDRRAFQACQDIRLRQECESAMVQVAVVLNGTQTTLERLPPHYHHSRRTAMNNAFRGQPRNVNSNEPLAQKSTFQRRTFPEHKGLKHHTSSRHSDSEKRSHHLGRTEARYYEAPRGARPLPPSRHHLRPRDSVPVGHRATFQANAAEEPPLDHNQARLELLSAKAQNLRSRRPTASSPRFRQAQRQHRVADDLRDITFGLGEMIVKDRRDVSAPFSFRFDCPPAGQKHPTASAWSPSSDVEQPCKAEAIVQTTKSRATCFGQPACHRGHLRVPALPPTTRTHSRRLTSPTTSSNSRTTDRPGAAVEGLGVVQVVRREQAAPAQASSATAFRTCGVKQHYCDGQKFRSHHPAIPESTSIVVQGQRLELVDQRGFKACVEAREEALRRRADFRALTRGGK
uniref:Uncharacterized protein n=1 Tax=Mycena chlorophos TaxID=658473 RepID=A0ABQ0KWK6_MYCCL|nr:predicted protein [Mycena chlorophos]